MKAPSFLNLHKKPHEKLFEKSNQRTQQRNLANPETGYTLHDRRIGHHGYCRILSQWS